MSDQETSRRLRAQPESPPTACPFCQNAGAQSVCLTHLFVYLRCVACQQVWNIPERRYVTRSEDATKAFLL